MGSDLETGHGGPRGPQRTTPYLEDFSMKRVVSLVVFVLVLATGVALAQEKPPAHPAHAGRHVPDDGRHDGDDGRTVRLAPNDADARRDDEGDGRHSAEVREDDGGRRKVAAEPSVRVPFGPREMARGDGFAT